MKTLFCIRKMPQTGTQNREMLRKNDVVRCLCKQPTCRDFDVTGNTDA